MPFGAREYAWLQYRDVAGQSDPDRSDDLHLYIPDIRKVRRGAAHQVEGLFMPSFAVSLSGLPGVNILIGASADVAAPVAEAGSSTITPKRSGFEGLEIRPLLYRFRVLGLQDVIATINAKRAMYPEEPNRSFGPWGLSIASDRWDLRRALVLEGTVADAPRGRGSLARLSIWIDLQTLYPLYFLSYDHANEVIDVGYYVGRWSEDRADYPAWPDRPDYRARVIDPVGQVFYNVSLRGSWRRESWNMTSTPPTDKEVRKQLSLRNLQKGR